MGINKTNVLPVPTEEKRTNPLRLDLQFFADNPEDKSKEKDPEPGDDDILTLKDMFKKYPHLRAEHKERVTEAVTNRFKEYTFDPEEAKQALAEKKQRDESGDNLETLKTQLTKDYQSKEEKLLGRIKQLAIASHAGKDGLDPKLISKLAADKVSTLKLDDDLNVDTEALDDIIEDLRTEFPTVFPAPSTEDNAEIPPVKKKGYNPGKDQTNKPPKGDESIEEEMAAILENINKRNPQ